MGPAHSGLIPTRPVALARAATGLDDELTSASWCDRQMPGGMIVRWDGLWGSLRRVLPVHRGLAGRSEIGYTISLDPAR